MGLLLNESNSSKNVLRDDFYPRYTPKEMLELGIFSGKYMNDIKGDFPADWFVNAKMVDPGSPADPSLNLYGVKSGMSLSHWEEKGWIGADSHGWFHWYCHYYLGRRIPDEDDRQIKRWRSTIARHMGQLKSNCDVADDECRKVQRQALLQWGWDSHDEWNNPRIKRFNQKHINKEMSKYKRKIAKL